MNTLETSRAASCLADSSADIKRAILLSLLKDHPEGLTDEQMQDLTGIGGSTQRPRRGELVRAGVVAARGIDYGDTRTYETRKTKSGCAAIVWRAV
jgi:hypothetical protein